MTRLSKVKDAARKFKRAIVVVIAGWVFVLLRHAGLELASEDVQTLVDFAVVAALTFVTPVKYRDEVKEVLEDE